MSHTSISKLIRFCRQPLRLQDSCLVYKNCASRKHWLQGTQCCFLSLRTRHGELGQCKKLPSTCCFHCSRAGQHKLALYLQTFPTAHSDKQLLVQLCTSQWNRGEMPPPSRTTLSSLWATALAAGTVLLAGERYALLRTSVTPALNGSITRPV